MRKRVLICDTETTPFGQRGIKPIVFGVLDCTWNGKRFIRNGTVFFEDVDSFMEYCCMASTNKTIAYFHNGAGFDFFFLRKFITGNVTEINGKIISFRCGDCEFRDSLAIIPCSLRKYKKDDFDYAKLYNYEKHKEEIKEYLSHDLEYTCDLIESFWQNAGQKLTVASCGFSQAAEICSFSKEDYLHRSKAFDAMFREYYFGGRVSCYGKTFEKREVKMYDINSSYPCAYSHNFPWGFDYTVKSNDAIYPQSFVELECDSDRAFPVRTNDGCDFPCGRFCFKITGWEYIKAVELGLIKNVNIIRVINFKKSTNMLPYKDKWYAIKANTPKENPLRTVAKYMLNAPYGKLALDWRSYNAMLIAPRTKGMRFTQQTRGKEMTYIYTGLWNAENAVYKANQPWGDFYHVAAAASITGFARSRLLPFLKSGLLYCDTDSVILEKSTLFPEKIGEDIGDWKHEGDFDLSIFCGKKMYYLENTITGDVHSASKGVKLNKQDFVRMALGHTVLYCSPWQSLSVKDGKETWLKRRVKNNNDFFETPIDESAVL